MTARKPRKAKQDHAGKDEAGENTEKNTEAKQNTSGLRAPWPKGVSGNPGGRPKSVFAQACRALLTQPLPDDSTRTYAQGIAQKLGDLALRGDIQAARELVDRAEGKPRQSVDFQDTTLHEAFERMTRDELEAYAREGEAALPAWFPRKGVHDGPIQ